jgi:hypothetical protein
VIIADRLTVVPCTLDGVVGGGASEMFTVAHFLWLLYIYFTVVDERNYGSVKSSVVCSVFRWYQFIMQL